MNATTVQLTRTEQEARNRLCEEYSRLALAQWQAGASALISPHGNYIKLRRSDGLEVYLGREQTQEILDSLPEYVDLETYVLATSMDM